MPHNDPWLSACGIVILLNYFQIYNYDNLYKYVQLQIQTHVQNTNISGSINILMTKLPYI